MTKAKTLIVDDHTLFRNGLKLVLETSGEFDVCGEAATGREALDLLETLKPELMVLDLHLPGTVNGKQVAAEALRNDPSLTVVVVTMHDDVGHLKQMLKHGVRGYLLKESNSEALLNACRSCLSGNTFIDPALTEHMVTAFVGRRASFESPAQEKLSTLTKREGEVFRQVALGFTNAEIATRLEISKRTVESHRRQLMAKLEIDSRAQLVRFALDNGVLSEL
jgi:DNA-binding NarL/FixJ family response regulator